MKPADARDSLPSIISALGIAGVLDQLIAHAHELTESLALSDDKLERFRAASDHRRLVEVREKVYH